MLVKIGKVFELEIEWSVRQPTAGAVFVKVGRFSRFWNTAGLPSH